MKPYLALSILAIAVWMCSAGCSAGAPSSVAPTAAATAEREVAVGIKAVDETPPIDETATATPMVPLPETKIPAEARQAVRLAIEDLVKRIGTRAATIQLIAVEAVQWSDTSLGCPKENTAYAQVITPGFRVTLKARGVEYEYHTDEGRFAVLCKP
jgi:hypothetical protein